MTDDTLARAQRLVSGFRGYQILVAACRFKLPDLLAAGPKTADELAAATGTHAPSMRRLLRGLAAWELVVEKGDGRFAATAVSEMFRADKPGLRNIAVMLSEEGYTVWGELPAVVRTGKPAYESVYGKPRWEMLAENPEAAAQFNAAMVETSKRAGAALIATYDFSSTRTVVDVGGGNGALLAAVLKANRGARGMLVDLAAGLAGAGDVMKEAGVDDRVTLVEGSFFESVPVGADLYMLKSIAHDWDDERALNILRVCRRAMTETSKLVLVERDLPEHIDDPSAALPTVMSDLQMMVVLGGRERTPREYAQVLEAAGLRMTRKIPLGSDFAAFEAVPI
jgi:hypothetical protein